MESVCTCGCQCKVSQAGHSPGFLWLQYTCGNRLFEYLPIYSFQTLADAMFHLFGVGMSQGTVSNMLNRIKKASAKSYDEIRREVQSSKVAGVDETGVKINEKGE